MSYVTCHCYLTCVILFILAQQWKLPGQITLLTDISFSTSLSVSFPSLTDVLEGIKFDVIIDICSNKMIACNY